MYIVVGCLLAAGAYSSYFCIKNILSMDKEERALIQQVRAVRDAFDCKPEE